MKNYKISTIAVLRVYCWI